MLSREILSLRSGVPSRGLVAEGHGISNYEGPAFFVFLFGLWKLSLLPGGLEQLSFPHPPLHKPPVQL